ncbi:MAG: MFS transporter [Deltaproteobacteria bacterium]|nr:MFS transporter [Deltaproteobacteria bacterium]
MTSRRVARIALLRVAAVYFFSFAALGSFFPYLPLLLAARGLRPAELTTVMTLLPVGNMLVPPLWGFLADALRLRSVLLVVACAGCAGSVFLFQPAWQFAGLLLAAAVLCAFRAPISTLADATTYTLLGADRHRFGVVRVWGSVGFGAAALVMGLLGGAARPTLLVVVCAGCYAASALAAVGLPEPATIERRGLLARAAHAAWRADTLLLLLATGCYYAGHACFDAYFTLHLGQLGATSAITGAAWGLGVLTEILLMVFAQRLLQSLPGAKLLAACAGVATLRWLVLAFTTTPALLLIAQPLHGITFGVWYLSLVREVQERTPDDLRTSLQGLTTSATGVGMVVGYVGGGSVFAHWAGRGLYACAAGAAALALALYALRARLLARAAAS